MSVELAFLLAIAEKVLKYGVPATIQLVRSWNVENPTEEDIQALRLKRPEAYFDEQKE